MAMSELLFKDLLNDLSGELPAGFNAGEDWSPELSPRQVAAICLVKSFLKKFSSSDRTTPSGDAVAVEKFLRSNERCRTWTYAPVTSLDEELMGEFKHLLYGFFHPSGDPLIHHVNDLFDHGRCGPGASIGARGEDFYTKFFDSPLTCTSGLLCEAFQRALDEDGKATWSFAELNRLAEHGPIQLTLGSRFSFVPKDDTTSRLIAIEPSLNMFYQLGLGRLLERRLVSYLGLDITSQPQINQEAARFGSVTDSLATLDLSNASDSMGLPMLKWALPKGVYDLLVLLRSPQGELLGEPLELNMVSTMGNGYTFPLETLLFSCVVVACIRSFRIKPRRPYFGLEPTDAGENPATEGYWGVFGDDIICHNRVTHRVIRLLTLLGFEVNRDKSFVEGVFRESCGRDFFRGQDVRGVYIKRLDTPEARYVAINSLNVWSAKTGIPLVSTVQRLMASVKWLFVPPSENHDAGIRVPSSAVKLEYNSNGSVLYKKRCSNPKKLTILDGEIRVPKRMKRRFYNPQGLLLAFLHGSVKEGRITLRQSEVRYHTKRGIVPYWDYVPPTSDIALLCGRSRWESATEVNLGIG